MLQSIRALRKPLAALILSGLSLAVGEVAVICRQSISSLAGQAYTLTTPLAIFYTCILTVKRMSMGAVCAVSKDVDKCQRTAKLILSIRDHFDMNWVHAVADSAQMVAHQGSLGDGHKQRIKRPMGALVRLVKRLHVTLSVPVLIQAALPFPARGALIKMLGRYFNLRKKPSEKFLADSGSNNQPLTEERLPFFSTLNTPSLKTVLRITIFMKLFSRKLGQAFRAFFMCYRVGSHSVFSLIENGLVRLGDLLDARLRAVSILAQSALRQEVYLGQ